MASLKAKKSGLFFFPPSESGKLRPPHGLPPHQQRHERVLWLISHEYVPEDVAELFDISQRSVARWRQNNRLYGSVIPPPNPMQCRPRILNADMTHDLYTLLEEAPEMYPAKSRIGLHLHMRFTSPSLHSTITSATLGYHSSSFVGQLQSAMKTIGRSGNKMPMHTSLHRRWSPADETSKDERTVYRHYGRSQSLGTARQSEPILCEGSRYSMVAALSLDGYESVHVVPGSVDGEEFLDFYCQ